MDIVSVRCRQWLLLLMIAAGLAACHPASRTVDDVINLNTRAMGGEKAIEAVQSIAVDLDIVDPGFAVDGSYRAARPGRMRIDVKMEGKHVFTEAFDGKRSWQWDEKGGRVIEATEKATAALRHGVELPGHLYGLHEMRKRGHQIELAGREKIEGIDYFSLRVTLNDGYTTTLYVDPKSWLITRRRDVRPLHVDIDPTPTTIEQYLSDFRQVAGVWFSFANTETDLKTGKLLETATVRTITVNPEIDAEIFRTL